MLRCRIGACALLACLAITVSAQEQEPLPFPHMVPFIGTLLEREYYDPGRMDPGTMYREALHALENARLDLELSNEEDGLVVNFGTDQVRLPIETPQTMDQLWNALQTVRQAVEARADIDSDDARNLVYAMMNGALRSLDPHTLLFPPEPASQFNEDIAGEFFGIGAYLSQEEGVIRIDRVMPGLPADQAGIQDGDRILYVDKETTAGLSLREAIRRIKGPKGTTVLLTVEREDEDQTIDIPVVRDRVAVITMRGKRHGPIAYVMMTEFNRYTYRDLTALIDRLQKEDEEPLRGMVLDLRFNGGGMLQQAIQISDLFLPTRKEVVRTVRLDRRPNVRLSSGRQVLEDLPIAVIISSQSASAAEILTGALQRHQRAVIFGQQSFGKGSVQILRPMPDESQLKLTIQEYQLAGGVSIQGQGVTPDVVLRRRRLSDDGHLDLVPFTGRHEADDEFALIGSNILEYDAAFSMAWLQEPVDEEVGRTYRLSSPEFSADQEAGLVLDLMTSAVQREDFQKLIAGEPLNMRDFTLDLLRPVLEERREAESAALAEALAAGSSSLSWGPRTEAAADDIKVSYAGPDLVQAGSSLSLPFVLKNESDQTHGRLFGLVRSDEASPFWEEEVIFGEVAAGDSVSANLDFTIPDRWYAGTEHFILDVYQDGSPRRLASVPVHLDVQELPRPRFSLTWSPAREDGIIDFGEPTGIVLHIENVGNATVDKAGVYILKKDSPFVQLQEGRWRFEDIQPGETVDVEVPFTVLEHIDWAGGQDYPGGPVTLQVQVVEDGGSRVQRIHRAGLYHEIDLPLGVAVNGGRISPPALELLEQKRTDDSFHARFQVTDDNPRFVIVYHGEEKVELRPVPMSGKFAIQRPLEAGLNEIRVMVSDEDEAMAAQPFRVWAELPEGALTAKHEGSADDDAAAMIP